jgi:diguanylate cyclase (GGDEF)-like protein
MHRLQPLSDLAENILQQLTHLLVANVSDSFFDKSKINAFLAVKEEEADLTTLAAQGKFKGHKDALKLLDKEVLNRIIKTMQTGRFIARETEVVIPLRVGELTLGVAYVEGPGITALDIDLVKILSNQATVAIQNIKLYEMATLDPLTGVHARRFFDRWIIRELRAAFRSKQSISMLMMDVDGLKIINDTAGHLTGDQALFAMGKVLRKATRSYDIVGRYGGDEFAVVLPNTDATGAKRVADRIIQLLKKENSLGPDKNIKLRSSIGLSSFKPQEFLNNKVRMPFSRSYFSDVAKILIKNADEMLYKAKHDGRGQLVWGTPLKWPMPDPDSRYPQNITK